MRLEDLRESPTAIRLDLSINGMPGATAGADTVTVSTRVVTPTSDDTYAEDIDRFTNAVVTGTASVEAKQGNKQRIEVKTAGTHNCYWLPWASGKVHCGTLGNAHTYFFTYTINGCGIIIGGTANAPFVAHANLESDRLLAPVLEVAGKSGTHVSPRQKLEAAQYVKKSQALTYEQFYGNLAATLIADGTLTGPRVTVITPEEYLIRADAGFGAVFGIKSDSHAWSFYGNWGGKTKKIWP